VVVVRVFAGRAYFAAPLVRTLVKIVTTSFALLALILCILTFVLIPSRTARPASGGRVWRVLMNSTEFAARRIVVILFLILSMGAVLARVFLIDRVLILSGDAGLARGPGV
jgi:hypothetical protein